MSGEVQLDWLATSPRTSLCEAQQRAKSHAADPESSRRAARRARDERIVSRQLRATLLAIVRHPGKTASELGHLVEDPCLGATPTERRYAIARRMGRLRDLALIEYRDGGGRENRLVPLPAALEEVRTWRD